MALVRIRPRPGPAGERNRQHPVAPGPAPGPALAVAGADPAGGADTRVAACTCRCRRRAGSGPVRCALPLPLANESMATVVIQHVAPGGRAGCRADRGMRAGAGSGRTVWLFALNPLSPYRWRWTGSGLRASEPMPWRRRLREAGLHPGCRIRRARAAWRTDVDGSSQHGLGLRAAYLLRAEKRSVPLTPLRQPGAAAPGRRRAGRMSEASRQRIDR